MLDAIRVLLVDDHAIARGGVRLLLGSGARITVEGEASNGHDALALMAGAEFDVALVDVSMPGMNGLDLLRLMRERRPKLPVIMLSTHSEEMYAVRALKSGAAGYLTKDVAPAVLVAAVRQAAAGGKYFSASLGELLVNQLQHGDREPALTNREFDVMKRLAAGETLTKIGQALFLSPKTVSTHRSRLLEKLGMTCNAQLTRYAMERGYI